MASVTTGFTAKRSLEAIGYYGGHVAGVAAIYSAVEEVAGHPAVAHQLTRFKKDVNALIEKGEPKISAIVEIIRQYICLLYTSTYQWSFIQIMSIPPLLIIIISIGISV